LERVWRKIVLREFGEREVVERDSLDFDGRVRVPFNPLEILKEQIETQVGVTRLSQGDLFQTLSTTPWHIFRRVRQSRAIESCDEKP